MNDRQPLPPLPDLARTLYTAVLSDVLDEAGFMSQALKPFVRPLDETSVMCGFARTGLYRKVYHVEPGRNPYEIEMDLIDSLAPGEVAVLACDGPRHRDVKTRTEAKTHRYCAEPWKPPCLTRHAPATRPPSPG
jgi:hypothetical protein